MAGVERFSVRMTERYSGASMVLKVAPGGSMVRYSDYEQVAAQRDKAIAERGALESAIKQHKQATESRLRLLAGAARQPEKSDLMLKPDADLYAALNSIQEGRDG